MATLVAELEMTAPLSDLQLPAGVSGALALVRRRGRPVGRVLLRGSGRVPAARIEAAIGREVRPPAEEAPPPKASPISIVVCTRDRPEELVRCLEALRAHAAHDVVVVDNAPSDDRTAALVTSFPYRYVREPAPGLDRARNRGIAEARREIVAFTDDDCVPDSGWVDALVSPYRDPEVAATTGLVMPIELETEAQERFEAYCANRRIFEPRVYRAPATPPSAAGVAGLGANMSFRRARLLELGGFDPRFDGGTATLSGGDTEVFARVLAAGDAIAYRPDALVWHRHRRDLESVRRVVFGYGVGVFAFFVKRLVEDGDMGVLVTAPRWLLGPPIKSAWNAVRGRPSAGADLVGMELWGALNGPLRYRSVRRGAAPR
jgi:GT2 family glycosyltransferase